MDKRRIIKDIEKYEKQMYKPRLAKMVTNIEEYERKKYKNLLKKEVDTPKYEPYPYHFYIYFIIFYIYYFLNCVYHLVYSSFKLTYRVSFYSLPIVLVYILIRGITIVSDSVSRSSRRICTE